MLIGASHNFIRTRTQIGSDWSIVCEQIRKAHYQPLLLVYTNPFGEAVDLSGVYMSITVTVVLY